MASRHVGEKETGSASLPLTPPDSISTFLKNAAAYSGTGLASQAAMFVQKLAIRVILAPALLGVWEFVLALQGFVSTFDLGLNAAAGVELPVLHGAERRAEAAEVRATVLWSNVAVGVVVAAGILLFVALSPNLRGAVMGAAAAVAAVLIVAAAVSDSFVTFYQGHQTYTALSKVLIVHAMLQAALLTGGAYLGGLAGLFVSGIVAYGLRAFLLGAAGRPRGVSVARTWSRLAFTRLIRFGLPLRVLEYAQSVMSYLDLFLVTRLGGMEGLAIYATAKTFTLQLANLPALVGNVFVMRMFYLSGAKRDRRVLGDQMRVFLLVEYLIVNPILICLLVQAFAFLTRQVIPRYADALAVIRVLPFALYFLPQTTLMRNFWMLDRRLGALGVSNLVGLVAMALAVTIAVTVADSALVAIAFATVCGYGVYYVFVLFSLGREMWGGVRAWTTLGYVVTAIAWTAAILALVPAAPRGLGLVADTLVLLEQLASCGLLLLPLVLFGLWRTRLLEYVRRVVVPPRQEG